MQGDLGKPKGEHLGLQFKCPKCESDKVEKKLRLGRIILDQPDAKCWLHLEWMLLFWQVKLSPLVWLQRVFPCSGVFVRLLVTVLLQVGGVYFWASGFPSDVILRIILRVAVSLLILWRFVDIFLSNLSFVFTTRFPGNPIRSAIYSMIAYMQIGLSYAFLFVALGQPHFKEVMEPASAMFFSFGTLVTVGYGNLLPQTVVARLAVVSELLLGLSFVVIILAQVATWAQLSRREQGDYDPKDLIDTGKGNTIEEQKTETQSGASSRPSVIIQPDIFRVEEFVHFFHEGYRKSGIALCISLAALAASEGWWLYEKHWSNLAVMSSGSCALWWLSAITAILVLLVSFYVQYRHYMGMKNQARWAYSRYAAVAGFEKAYDNSPVDDAKLYHKTATCHLTEADRKTQWLLILALSNFTVALLFLLLLRSSQPIG
jgi:hypothetical protein